MHQLPHFSFSSNNAGNTDCHTIWSVKGPRIYFEFFPWLRARFLPWNMYLLRYSEQRVLRSKELGNLYTLVHSGRVHEVHEHIKGPDKSCSNGTAPHLVLPSAPLLFDHTH